MADAKIYRFTVSGHGRFPFDMLRYDRCWPAVEREMELLDQRAGARIIRMEGIKPPTEARWASFGWGVTV